MTNEFKVISYAKAGQYLGVAISFDGVLSHVKGPFPTRREAREKMVEHVEKELGGVVVKRVRIGAGIQHLGQALEGSWP